MTPLLLAGAFGSLVATAEASQECVASSFAPALDHVVVVVRNLDAASAAFRANGFKLKLGRLHANNLLNRHVKFRDGSGLELMTVHGEPRDRMSREYAALAASGEGGVYASLTVSQLTRPAKAAASLRLQSLRSSSGPWQFISFPAASPAAAVFFSAGSAPVSDADSLVSHEPDVTGLTEAWVEGDRELVLLLEQLGAKRCGTARSPDGRHGLRVALRRGSLVVLPRRSRSRPNVPGVVLQARSSEDTTVWAFHNFWVQYR